MSARARLSAGLVALVVTSACAAVAVAGAPAASARAAERVGVADPGRVAFGFVGRIQQDGPTALDFGYLHYVTGLEESRLFTGDDPLLRDAATARFTYVATARVEHRSINGNVFATWGSAQTELFLQHDGGADLEDPASFGRGQRIATFESRWFDVLNVQSPDRGIARVESDDTQLSATPFELDGQRLTFGHRGFPLRLSFTGQGVRSQAEPPQAVILYAGEATSVATRGGRDGRSDGVAPTSSGPALGAAVAVGAGGLLVAAARSRVVRRRRPPG